MYIDNKSLDGSVLFGFMSSGNSLEVMDNYAATKDKLLSFPKPCRYTIIFIFLHGMHILYHNITLVSNARA